MLRSFIGLVVGFGLVLSAGSIQASELSEISADDFYGAAYFEQALTYPEVSKLKTRKKRIRRVARDMGWKRKKLEHALSKVESLEGAVVDLAKKAIQEEVASTRVKGRLLDVLVNTDEPKHVVMYVVWRGTKSADAIKDAATLAAIVAKRVPLVSTLSLSAIHPKAAADNRVSVWSGKIAASAMRNISPTRIEDYADRLYKRLFEGIEERPF